MSFEVNKFIFAWFLIKKTSLLQSKVVFKHELLTQGKSTHVHAESLISGNLYDNYEISDGVSLVYHENFSPMGSFYKRPQTRAVIIYATHDTERQKKGFSCGNLEAIKCWIFSVS